MPVPRCMKLLSLLAIASNDFKIVVVNRLAFVSLFQAQFFQVNHFHPGEHGFDFTASAAHDVVHALVVIGAEELTDEVSARQQ